MGLDDRQFAADDRIPKRNGGVGVGARVENHAVGPLAGVMEGLDQRALVVRLDVTQLCASLGGDGGELGDDVVELDGESASRQRKMSNCQCGRVYATLWRVTGSRLMNYSAPQDLVSSVFTTGFIGNMNGIWPLAPAHMARYHSYCQ